MLEAKQNFVRSISHEIRTPVNTLSMGLKVIRRALKEGEDRPSILETLGDVDGACDVAVEILNSILSYEKLKAGKLELERVAVNAWEFIMNTIGPFRIQVSQRAERNIHISVEQFCVI